ncbi:MAG: hypothetical protein AMXMBFR25_06810 [Lysobacterales bacterium]
MLLPILLALAACGQDTGSSGPVRLVQIDGPASALKVDGEAVPEALVDAYARKRGWDLHDPGQREQVYEQLTELLAVASAARKQGLMDDESVRADLELERLNRLSGMLVERATGTLTDADLRAAYDQEIVAAGNEEFLVAHILFERAELAAPLLAALQGGASFDEQMRALAGQPGVRDAKDLGWVRRNSMPPALAEAVAGLADGAYTPAAVQSEFGWHVALLRSRRALNVPPFEQVREAVEASVKRKRAQEIAKQARAEVKVEK